MLTNKGSSRFCVGKKMVLTCILTLPNLHFMRFSGVINLAQFCGHRLFSISYMPLKAMKIKTKITSMVLGQTMDAPSNLLRNPISQIASGVCISR